ncbi:MAG: TIGR00282 family metallophosphoesterase [Candidatus Cloacimonetes bacterium]|nr:TIGR00282 family metallophosphoesterase [Candidatus Cloacimonadota bacterium]
MKILFLGDVFGKSGRDLVLNQITRLKDYYMPEVLIINGENLADGKGLTEKTTKPLFSAGVDIITGGNHLWDRFDSRDFIQSETRIIKPLNYPSSSVGNPYRKISAGDEEILVLSLTGQLFMPPCNSPFEALETFLTNTERLPKAILVDFHAESTAEKRALLHMFDGKVSAIIGTHTHIQTADEEITEAGTGYITDVGMTGPHDSVIGIKKHLIMEKMKTCMPIRYEVADSGLQINGIYLEIDTTTGQTVKILRIRELIRD